MEQSTGSIAPYLAESRVPNNRQSTAFDSLDSDVYAMNSIAYDYWSEATLDNQVRYCEGLGARIARRHAQDKGHKASLAEL